MSDFEILGKKVVRLRKAVASDLPFITDSWLSSYRRSWAVKNVRNTEYYAYEHRMLEEMIPRCMTVVLCPENDDDHIWGWACYEMREQEGVRLLVLHYILIRDTYQKHGLATQLLDKLIEIENPHGVTYTYNTYSFTKFLAAQEEKTKDWRHNPYVRFKEYLKL